MVNTRRTIHTLIVIVVFFFMLSVMLSVASGIGVQEAFIDNALDSLQVNYSLAQFSSASNPPFLLATLLDATIFPILTVILATVFFDFINNININERLILTKIKKLKNHVIVVPYNSFAKSVMSELKGAGMKYVTIASSKKDLMQLYKSNELVLEGDLRSVETFNIAGLNKARCVVACGKDDIQNALISITAKAADPDMIIITRLNDDENLDKLEKAGAYKTVFMESTAGKDMGEEIAKRLLSKRMLKNN